MIAPQSDVIIEIISSMGLATLEVSSQVLCVTSPVFRAMLGTSSPFKEACELRGEAGIPLPYRLALKGDNPEALGVILLALHCQHDRVPRSISFERLHSLAVICDKYDCTTGVSPWVDIWVGPWKAYATVEGYEQWLFIAWVFDQQDVFEKISKKFIIEGYDSTSVPGALMIRSGIHLDMFMLPEFIVRLVKERRNQCIKSMAQVAITYRERYLNPPGSQGMCKLGKPDEGCDALILGSLMRGFLALGIAQDFNHSTIRSIKGLSGGIKKLQIEFFPSYVDLYSRTNTHKQHCDPLPQLKTEIHGIVNKIKGIDLSCHNHQRTSQRTRAAAAKWDIFTYS